MTTPNSDSNPHIREKHSPLQALAMQALRRYGDFHPGTIDGDVMLMFIDFANMIIDEVRAHPYAPLESGKTTIQPIDYYVSQTDVREIKDIIIVQGLLYHYAVQQGSDKIQFYMPTYYNTLNRELWEAKNGNTKIQLAVVDDGTNKRNINGGKTSALNGSVSY